MNLMLPRRVINPLWIIPLDEYEVMNIDKIGTGVILVTSLIYEVDILYQWIYTYYNLSSGRR